MSEIVGRVKNDAWLEAITFSSPNAGEEEAR
jgi:hypothetical protein